MNLNRRRLAFFVLVIILGVFLAMALAQQTQPGQADEQNVRGILRTFASVYSVVEQNYADPVNPDHAIYEGAIPGMLRPLDPHSTFFDPKAFADLQEEQSGKYYGVGMTIGPRNNRIVVIAPVAGSPAYRAGIRPGDVIVAIDGKSADNMTSSDVADLVRGPKGTTVRITILRPGASQPLDLTVTRAEIPRNSVDVHFLAQPGIGYIHISVFNETTDRELQQALNQFGNLQGLVLDLRQDPGGLLDQAVKVADKFLPRGAVVVSQRGRASPEKVYRAAHGSTADYPIVVLVDRGTASAAEIVSGALQDHDRALIAGENTFGKGLVQTVFPLSEETGLALTTAKYYTPSGRLIQRNYEGISLFDYYYNHENAKPNKDVKTTDSGRPVYGGDGITPDVKIASPKLNEFQNQLLQHYVFFEFAENYVPNHKIPHDFDVSGAVLQDFRNYLRQHEMDGNSTEVAANLDWIKSNIKTEIMTQQFGMQAGLMARAQSDPEVMRAINLLPQAEALQVKAKRLMAERAEKSVTDKTR